MWNEQQDQTLIQLWMGGHSAGQIAEVMKGCTRNAVIGRVNRLRLNGVALTRRPRRRRIKPPPKALRPRPRSLAPPRPLRSEARVLRTLEPTPPPVVVLKPGEVEPNGTPASLVELCAAACRWSVSQTSPHLFCNKIRRGGSPYCDEHTLKSYQPRATK